MPNKPSEGARYNQIMDPFDYLTRIRYAGAIKPDAQTLRGLHLAHMLSVPFENLNIGLKRPILLNEGALENLNVGALLIMIAVISLFT